MKVVGRRIVFAGCVALQAYAVSRRPQLEGMRIVTIAAGDAGVKHSALDEGPVFVNLAFDLSVGKVEILVQDCDAVIIADWLAVDVILVDLGTS